MTYQEIISGISDRIIKSVTEKFKHVVCNHQNVHNFSLPTLSAYFYLDELLEYKHPPILLENDMIFLPSLQGRYKTFCYKPPRDIDRGVLQFLQIVGPIYSIHRIPFLEKETKFVEVGYDLEKVFDPSSYPVAKKRHQRLVYPFKQIEKFKVEEVDLEDHFNEVEDLHSQWVDRKMNDPNTFRMMFPNKRYIQCCEKALYNKDDFKSFIFSIDSKVIAVRILGIAGDLVVDLANFGRTWDMPSNMMNYLDTLVLKKLYLSGYRTFNCGAALNSRLKMFKNHYPSKDIVSWQYSRKKI